MNIRFKEQSEVDFSKIFPVIDPEDYALLENQTISLDEIAMDQLKSNKYLEFAGYKISEALIELKQENGVSATQADIQAKISEKYINSEQVVDVLMAGIETNRNVMLWGRGGHGKSEITTMVMEELLAAGQIDEKPYVMAFGDGLTEDKLYGGMNIKKYKEEGKIEYLPENSFMNHEIVIFEEIFDAPAPVLLGLKDIMTSREFRQGNETFKVKTKTIIGLTNLSKTEFAEKNESLKALAERFALTLKVEWESYNRKDFIALFKKVYGDDFYKKHSQQLTTLSSIIDMNNAEGMSFVSPRTAVAAADLYTRGKSLEYISEINPSILKKYKQQIIEEEKNSKHELLMENVKAYITKHDLEFVDESEDFLRDLANVEGEMTGKEVDLSDLDFGSQNDKQAKLNRCNYVLDIINRQTPTQSMANDFSALKKRMDGITKSLKDAIKQDENAAKAASGELGEDSPF